MRGTWSGAQGIACTAALSPSPAVEKRRTSCHKLPDLHPHHPQYRAHYHSYVASSRRHRAPPGRLGPLHQEPAPAPRRWLLQSWARPARQQAAGADPGGRGILRSTFHFLGSPSSALGGEQRPGEAALCCRWLLLLIETVAGAHSERHGSERLGLQAVENGQSTSEGQPSARAPLHAGEPRLERRAGCACSCWDTLCGGAGRVGALSAASGAHRGDPL